MWRFYWRLLGRAFAAVGRWNQMAAVALGLATLAGILVPELAQVLGADVSNYTRLAAIVPFAWMLLLGNYEAFREVEDERHDLRVHLAAPFIGRLRDRRGVYRFDTDVVIFTANATARYSSIQDKNDLAKIRIIVQQDAQKVEFCAHDLEAIMNGFALRAHALHNDC